MEIKHYFSATWYSLSETSKRRQLPAQDFIKMQLAGRYRNQYIRYGGCNMSCTRKTTCNSPLLATVGGSLEGKLCRLLSIISSYSSSILIFPFTDPSYCNLFTSTTCIACEIVMNIGEIIVI